MLDEVLFPTQIIVTRELDVQNHTWLRSLSGKLKKEEMRKLLEQIDTLTETFEIGLADAVLEVSVRANQEIVEELKGDEHMCQALLEIMEPEISKIAKEAAEKAAKEAAKEAAIKEAKETAINMLKSGKFIAEEIKEYIPRLSVEEIKAIARSLNN